MDSLLWSSKNMSQISPEHPACKLYNPMVKHNQKRALSIQALRASLLTCNATFLMHPKWCEIPHCSHVGLADFFYSVKVLIEFN